MMSGSFLKQKFPGIAASISALQAEWETMSKQPRRQDTDWRQRLLDKPERAFGPLSWFKKARVNA